MNSVDVGIFAALIDAQLFQQVSIESGALTWRNGADWGPLRVDEEIGKNRTWPVLAWFPLGSKKRQARWRRYVALSRRRLDK